MLAKTWYNLFKKILKNNIHLYGYKIIFHCDFNLHFPNDYAKAFDCVDHNKLENSERDGNTRPPDLPLEKPIYRSGSNS